MSPQKWIETTNAAGFVSKSGKYDGGTYAHKDIAFKFASWISPEFELYMVKEFQRLKEQEQAQLGWTVKRELAKVNYRIHTDAIKQNLIVPKLTPNQISYTYANEGDLLNVALFGKTVAQWRKDNQTLDGNIRDYATAHQLLVLANMESYNAVMIKDKIDSGERLQRLNDMARTQLEVMLQMDNKFLLPPDNKK
jgi:hypothetical protein